MSDDVDPTDDARRAERKQPPKETSTDRRGALGVLVGVGSLAYAGALAGPGYRYLTGGGAGQEPSRESWKRVAKVDQLRDGAPERVKVVGETRDAFTISRNQTLGSVWLQRSGDSVRAFSAECPHLGCAIDLGGDAKSFSCPCHTSRFGLDGRAESGPSPRGMDELAVRIVDGFVEVDFRRFRQGVGERVEVG